MRLPLIFLTITLYLIQETQIVYGQNTTLSIKTTIDAFNTFIKKYDASWSFCLLDEKGNKIAFHQPDQLAIPASTIKIITTTPAWDLLGSNFKFQTHVEYSGYIDNDGILVGNIYIKGEGDPTLGSSRFPGYPSTSKLIDQIIQIIQKQNIKTIHGDLFIDSSFFKNLKPPRSWLNTDIGNYYGAFPQALCIQENQYKLILQSGKKIGDSVRIVKTDPAFIPNLQFVNELKTGSVNSGDQASINYIEGDSIWHIQGTIPLSKNRFTIKGSLPNPGELLVYMLKSKLKILGIKILHNNISSSKRTRLHTFSSPHLFDILTIVNQKSQNLFAEQIFLLLGYVYKKEISYSASVQTIKDYWNKKGINLTSATIIDGSGLSPQNNISCSQLASILKTIQEEAYFPQFIKTLSTSGEYGTLRSWQNDKLKGKIIGKSGNMKLLGTKAYAGYLKKSDKLLSFTLFINNYQHNNVHLKKQIELFLENIIYAIN